MNRIIISCVFLAVTVSGSRFRATVDDEPIPVENQVLQSVIQLIRRSDFEGSSERLTESFPSSLFTAMYIHPYARGSTQRSIESFNDELKAAGFKTDTFASVPNIVRFLMAPVGLKVAVISTTQADMDGVDSQVAALDHAATDIVLVSVKDIRDALQPSLAFPSSADVFYKIVCAVGNEEFVTDPTRQRVVFWFRKRPKPDVSRMLERTTLDALHGITWKIPFDELRASEFPVGVLTDNSAVGEVAVWQGKGWTSFDDLPEIFAYYLEMMGRTVSFGLNDAEYSISREPIEDPKYSLLFQTHNKDFLDGENERVPKSVFVYKRAPAVNHQIVWQTITMLSYCDMIRAKMYQDESVFTAVVRQSLRSFGDLETASPELVQLTADLEERGNKMNTLASVANVVREYLIYFGVETDVVIVSTKESDIQAKIARAPITPKTEYVIVSVHNVIDRTMPDLGSDFALIAEADNRLLVENEPERRRIVSLFQRRM